MKKNKTEPKETRAPSELERTIDRARAEHLELAERIQNLEMFMASWKYQEVGPKQQVLLTQQRDAMKKYDDVLLARIIDLQYKAKKEAENLDKMAEG